MTLSTHDPFLSDIVCPFFPFEVFAEADEDGGGGLDMEEFRQAMRQSMGKKNISDQDLDQIFMKVAHFDFRHANRNEF